MCLRCNVLFAYIFTLHSYLIKRRVHNPNFALRPVEKQAEVIAKAIGPSGRNSEYLFQLADFVRFANGNDESLFHLEASVRRIIEISKN